jgi:MFS family permease
MAGWSEHLRDSRTAMADVFRNRSLRRMNLAYVGSVVGDWAYAVALSIYAYQRGGAGVVGALFVVRYVLTAVGAPLAATFADRFDRRRVMIVADLLRMVLIGTSAIVVIADGPSLSIYVLSVAASLVGLAFRPAQLALLPSLVTSPSELTAANVVASTIHSVGFFAGPAIAGVLLVLTDIGAVLVFDALTFAWSAVLVFGIHIPDSAASRDDVDGTPEAEHDGDDASAGGAIEGFRTLFQHRDLRLLALLYTAQTVVAGASAVYEVAIALDLLDIGDGGLGALTSTLGIGGIIGGGIALVLAQRGRLARDFGIGVMLWSAPLLLVAVWPTLVSTLVAMLLIGVGNSVVDVSVETIFQRLVPDEVLGRVFGALESVTIAGMAAGALVMPILIDTVGLRTGLAIVAVVVSSAVIVSLVGLRRIDRVTLAPEGVGAVRGVPMLSVLPEHTVERLARRSVVVVVAPGECAVRQGEVGDRFYIVEQGTAEVLIDGDVVGSFGSGDFFGEIALLRDVPRTATVRATSELRVRAIERGDFLPAVTGHAGASEHAEIVIGRWMDAR